MSYVLVIWEGKRPDSDESAVAAYCALRDRYLAPSTDAADPREPPTPAIASLVASLLGRWPDIDQPGGEESPWADAPLANDALGPVICLSIASSMLGEAVPFVVEQAAIRNLVCFDPQGPPYLL